MIELYTREQEEEQENKNECIETQRAKEREREYALLYLTSFIKLYIINKKEKNEK